MIYGISTEVVLSFEEANRKVREELKKEGFGVLTEIDAKKTLKEKLDVDYDNYMILGALLPCNVIVYRKDEKTFVSAINPKEAMGMVENEELEGIASEVAEKLKRVMEAM